MSTLEGTLRIIEFLTDSVLQLKYTKDTGRGSVLRTWPVESRAAFLAVTGPCAKPVTIST